MSLEILSPVRAEPAAPDERLALKFRVLSIEGKRRAFRLEAVFWSALEFIAGRRRRSLPAQVAAILRDAGDEANAAAAVRARVASDLMDLQATDAARAVSPSWEKVLKAVPHPAFALARNQAVVALNEPMWALLESRGLPRAADEAAPGERLSVELSAGALARPRAVDPGEVVLCTAIFRAAGRAANCRVRIVQAVDEREDRRLMLGFPEAV
jgi:predicted DNA-binding ribbon-helix-helix protein